MATLGLKIKTAREASGLKQIDLAKKLNVKNTTISNWENNVSKPDVEILPLLCGILHISPNHLFNEEFETNSFSDDEKNLIGIIRKLSSSGKDMIFSFASSLLEYEKSFSEVSVTSDEYNQRILPLYDIPASAGTGIFLDSDNYEMVTVGNDAPMNANFMIRVSGNSMEPTLNDGEIIYIKQQELVENKEIGIFLYEGNVYVKRFIKKNNKCFLVSDNKAYSPIEITECETIKCYGKVIIK